MYPKALYYPYHITSELLGPQGLRLTSAAGLGGLRQLLRDDTMDCFVQALHGLHHPELRW